ncbi:MAG: hypothetical protein D9V47_08800 [Clostridia bacterium]|nr:MAG: hypothetical protein D9V47_08800 [Clostridia bacterium]
MVLPIPSHLSGPGISPGRFSIFFIDICSYWYWATGVPGWARFGPWPGAYPVPWGYPFDPAAGPAAEKKFLQQQASLLEKQLQEIKDRLADLEKQVKEEEQD